MELFIWIGIFFCLSQSAMFSGLNLAFFNIPRLRLEIEAGNLNPEAQKVLMMRTDSNFLLTTILWGNVGINVLLTLLSGSVMAGMTAFLFSTFLITFFGEIIPQAYFSRHALRMASLMAPVLRFYQFLLYPVAKPSAKLLDVWLGGESIHYFKEKSLKQLIRKHVEETKDIDLVEGVGAINFLTMDDLLISEEGETIHPESIIELPYEKGMIQFPVITSDISDEFLQALNLTDHKWVIVVDKHGTPQLVIDADGLTRAALFSQDHLDPLEHAHFPIVIRDEKLTLGDAIQKLETDAPGHEADAISRDVILLWGTQRKIITGADILGRLLRGIVPDPSA